MQCSLEWGRLGEWCKFFQPWHLHYTALHRLPCLHYCCNFSDICFKTVNPSSLLFVRVLRISLALVYCITTTPTEQETRSKSLCPRVSKDAWRIFEQNTRFQSTGGSWISNPILNVKAVNEWAGISYIDKQCNAMLQYMFIANLGEARGCYSTRNKWILPSVQLFMLSIRPTE